MSFKSPSDHVLCGVCLKHQRSDSATLRRANAEHAKLWAADAADRAGQHEREVAKLREERDNLARELELRPVRTIEVSLDKQTVDEALQAKDRAYRARLRDVDDFAHFYVPHGIAGPVQMRSDQLQRGATLGRFSTRDRSME